MAARTIVTLAGACLALAACNSSNNGAALPAEAGDPGPLGLVFDTAVNVMSSDRQEGNTVTVSQELATIELVSLDLDGGTFEIELGLPDGTSVTLTDDDLDDDFYTRDVNDQRVLRANLNTGVEGEGDEVHVLIGLGLGAPSNPGDLEPGDADEALFMLARVDQAEPEVGEGEDPIADQGFNVYMVTGEETETLPSGVATYSGDTIATAYVDGEILSDRFFGDASVVANFAESSVDIRVDGSYRDDDIKYEYELVGDDLAVEGSRYTGALGVAGFLGDETSTFTTSERRTGCWGHCSYWHEIDEIDVAGDVIGAFYGENAEATAGVFGAEETNFEDTGVEIVGGFAAYADNADNLIPDDVD